jgi:hypothetical protein
MPHGPARRRRVRNRRRPGHGGKGRRAPADGRTVPEAVAGAGANETCAGPRRVDIDGPFRREAVVAGLGREEEDLLARREDARAGQAREQLVRHALSGCASRPARAAHRRRGGDDVEAARRLVRRQQTAPKVAGHDGRGVDRVVIGLRSVAEGMSQPPASPAGPPHACAGSRRRPQALPSLPLLASTPIRTAVDARPNTGSRRGSCRARRQGRNRRTGAADGRSPPSYGASAPRRTPVRPASGRCRPPCPLRTAGAS